MSDALRYAVQPDPRSRSRVLEFHSRGVDRQSRMGLFSWCCSQGVTYNDQITNPRLILHILWMPYINIAMFLQVWLHLHVLFCTSVVMYSYSSIFHRRDSADCTAGRCNYSAGGTPSNTCSLLSQVRTGTDSRFLANRDNKQHIYRLCFASVCDIGALWLNTWMDQVQTSPVHHAGFLKRIFNCR